VSNRQNATYATALPELQPFVINATGESNPSSNCRGR
jgi:hypothetical protein